jgi:hypothetical protein
MDSYNNFLQSMFLHEQQEDRKKQELGARETMEGELWSIFGVEY